jgi:heme oxygenase (biliverdin-IX-beta and delta-forming)
MIIQKLKKETSYLHNKLESNRLLNKLTKSDISKEEYSKIILKFSSFFTPLEIKIFSFIEIFDIIPDIKQRRKSSLLSNDIQALKNGLSNLEDVQKPKLPEIISWEHAVGCFYVMEGSALGGRVIYKNINKNLNLSNVNGASFFYGYGEDTGLMWKKFVDYYSHLDVDSKGEGKMIKAAQETFEYLDYWFEI